MPSNEKLAAALEELRERQADGSRVFASRQFARAARERLISHGFLREVMRGWLLSTDPSTQDGDTTPWFSSFWEFCARYCNERFADAWHLSPEQSLLLHSENTTVPKQVIIYSPEGGNDRVSLLFATSLFTVKEKAMPHARDVETRGAIRVFTSEAALIRVPGEFFRSHRVEAQVVLGQLKDPSNLLVGLLEGGHSVVAGRLVGAFRRIGRSPIADEIANVMKKADHDVRELDPFEEGAMVEAPPRSTSAIESRLRVLWASARDYVTNEFPTRSGLPKNVDAYLREVDDTYKLDAYHSLSIEGYRVTPGLIARVVSGEWNQEQETVDRENKDALAARGYYLAFLRVRETVGRIVGSRGDRRLLRAAHREWYREMFSPNVDAGLLAPSMLAGYRTHPVYLRGSRHVPPRSEAVADAMSCLFDLIEGEPSPAVRAVLGHWLVGYVHPFPDGNGRIARFLMNVLLAEGGYPWTIIRVEQRDAYMNALEVASVNNDVRPFASFIADQMSLTKTR